MSYAFGLFCTELIVFLIILSVRYLYERTMVRAAFRRRP